MAIKSVRFGGVELNGEDSEAFLRQVDAGPTEKQLRLIAKAIERGRRLARDIQRSGQTRVNLPKTKENWA